MPLFPQRGPSQGSRLYTNADLVRRRPAEETNPIPADGGMLSSNPGGRSPIDALLAQAHQTLDSGDHLAEEYDAPADDGSVAEYNANAPSVMDSMGTKVGRFARQQGSRMWNNAKTIAPYAALAAIPLGGPVGPIADAVLTAGAGEDIAQHGPNIGNVAMAGGGAIGALKGLTGVTKGLEASKAAATAADNALMANQAERELVDSYASSELASGSQRGPQSILRDAHDKAGRIHGEETIRKTQLHPDYPELPALNIKRSPMDALRKRIRESQVVEPEYQPFTNDSVAALGAGPLNTYQSGARSEIGALRNLIRQSIR